MKRINLREVDVSQHQVSGLAVLIEQAYQEYGGAPELRYQVEDLLNRFYVYAQAQALPDQRAHRERTRATLTRLQTIVGGALQECEQFLERAEPMLQAGSPLTPEGEDQGNH